MMTLGTNAMLPMWLVGPVAGFAVLVISLHLVSLVHADMPMSRKRIRAANGGVCIVVAMLLGYALGVTPVIPSGGGSAGQVHAFVVVWMFIFGLLPIVVGLAGLDVANTLRIQMATRKALRAEMRAKLARDLEVVVMTRRARNAVGSAGSGAGDDARA